MPYVARNPGLFLGHSVGDGQCVALVEQAAHTPSDKHWHRGPQVKGDLRIPVGTAIAVFDPNGSYGNHTNHTSHAAIYLGQSAEGILVMDQWVTKLNGKHYPQVAHKRTILFGHFHGYSVDNGDNYFVVQ